MADRTISLTENGEQMPLSDIVTGRGFVTGKSGSGKSNTCSVLAEELLEQSVPMLIVDTDGEYFGLKEQYELLHVGGDDRCDLKVGPQHADKLADVAIDSRVPVILDVSGFIEQEDANRLVHDVVRALFVKEKEARIPFLLFVEEAHEFIPEQGGLDETGEMLVRVAKRGRKRGLGIVAISQRPASVDKDFITQCDWLVWHRLTWENDTQVVAKIMGSQSAEEVQTLDPGEAILMTDWDERRRRVQFRRKRTLDAGATPDMDNLEGGQPSMKAVGGDVMDELSAAGASVTEAGEDAFAEAEEQAGSPAAGADGEGLDSADAAEGVGSPPEQPPHDDGDGGAAGDAAGRAGTDDDATGVGEDDAEADEPPATAEAAAAGDAAASQALDSTPTPAQPDGAAPPAPADDGANATTAPANPGGNGDAGTTEATLEQVARNVQPREPARAGRRNQGPSPNRADDPVWEVAEFVAYVVASVGAASVHVATTVRRSVLRLVSDSPLAPPEPRDREGYRVVGALVTVVLLLLGILLGIGVATLVS